ncbi:MAG: c-type cytochrome [Gemmataceae bacterium]|nr:c-type cytochrome [Gemmataceae bacterium]
MKRTLLAAWALLVAASPAAAQKQFGFDNAKPSGQPYLTPEETVRRMKVPEGFRVELFAGEPMVINPIAFTVDERGRLWVVECYEYPSRTPPGKMPRDRIVILEDTDGDGRADKRTVFCEGKDFPDRFDLASGIEVGHGGVFLGAAPFLWFIENKNDKPGRFEKLLSGFGSQDTHETLNTFQWGPDGWLYGLHGIFTHSNVKSAADGPGVKMDAAVWRYHPTCRKFEIVAEGTSNPWGWDFRNSDGEMILACCVIPHLFHITPGGIYKRQAGSSKNPYAYGYLNEICDHTFHKESGWAHAGLLSLDTAVMPKEYRDSVIFGSIHGSSIKRNTLKRHGSTFIASKAPDFLVSEDKNVRPINLRWGPNGEIYLIDWHDQNPCHQAEAGSWDYERGRVYRIVPPGVKAAKAPDLAKLTNDDLKATFWDEGHLARIRKSVPISDEQLYAPWMYRTCQRLRDERGPALGKSEPPMAALDGLPVTWRYDAKKVYSHVHRVTETTRRACGVSTPEAAQQMAEIRIKVYREVFDSVEHDAALVGLVAEWAVYSMLDNERRVLASMAVRLADKADIEEVVHPLMRLSEPTDPVLPLLLWWAYEPTLVRRTDAELSWLRTNAAERPFVADHILPRAVRRIAAMDISRAVDFVTSLNGAPQLKALEGLATAMEGRLVDPPASWVALKTKLESDRAAAPSLKKLAVCFRDRAAAEAAFAVLRDATRSPAERLDALPLAQGLRSAEVAQVCCELASQTGDVALRRAALRSLAEFDGAMIPEKLLAAWPTLPPTLRGEAVGILAGRKEWAKQLIGAVESKRVAVGELNTSVALRLHAYKDKELSATVDRVWGPVRVASADMGRLIDEKRLVLQAGSASFSRGKKLFTEHCGKCHQFEGAGHHVGPALDGAGRDIEYLLVNVLDPNRVVGAPYQLRRAILNNGRIEEGMLQAEDANTVTLIQENDQLKVLPRKDIDELQVSEKSVMPEGLTKPLSDQDFRDLIRYAMAHPYVIAWQVEGRSVAAPITGAWTLPANTRATAGFSAGQSMTTKLQIVASGPVRVMLDGNVVYDGPKTDASIEVKLAAGAHRLTVESVPGATLSVRLLDPDRRLTYPE